MTITRRLPLHAAALSLVVVALFEVLR